jgi:hypothetical protein
MAEGGLTPLPAAGALPTDRQGPADAGSDSPSAGQGAPSPAGGIAAGAQTGSDTHSAEAHASDPLAAGASVGGPALETPAPTTLLWIEPGRCRELVGVPDQLPDSGYAWIDAIYESPRAWVDPLLRLTGITPLDEHLSDAENATHRSYFDSTRDYEMIVFRGLADDSVAQGGDSLRIRSRP